MKTPNRTLTNEIFARHRRADSSPKICAIRPRFARFAQDLRGSPKICAVRPRFARFAQDLRGSPKICAVRPRFARFAQDLESSPTRLSGSPKIWRVRPSFLEFARNLANWPNFLASGLRFRSCGGARTNRTPSPSDAMFRSAQTPEPLKIPRLPPLIRPNPVRSSSNAARPESNFRPRGRRAAIKQIVHPIGR